MDIKERNQKIIEDRLLGLTREAIAEKHGVKLSLVKTVLGTNKIVLPMEKRQSNAYEAKLAKNPNAMFEMRKTLTPEVVEKRSESVRKAYKNQDLIDLKAEQNRNYWANQQKTSKYSIQNAIDTSLHLKMVVDGNPQDILPSHLSVTCFCGTKFAPRGFDFIYGKIRSCGCVKSVNQNEIAQLVQEWGFETSLNDRTIISPFELDIYLPKEKLAIEYCGIYYHGESMKNDRTRHLDKYLMCKELGIRLVTIFSDEWIQRRENVIGYLGSILGKNITRIGARKTKLYKVNSAEIMGFMDANHIQGGRIASINYALKIGNEIVAAAKFNHCEEGLELTRWCVKAGLAISGGFSKILSAAKEGFPEKSIITFSDLRWSNGSTYERHGFKQIGVVEPSYWYFKNNSDFPRFHKGLFRKEKIAVKLGALLPEETEWEAMRRFGFDRIWDCGLTKWRLDPTPEIK